MSKNFNWNYKSDHALGQSHVTDHKVSTYAQYAGMHDPLDTRISECFAPRPSASAQTHAEELAFVRNRDLLDNIHA